MESQPQLSDKARKTDQPSGLGWAGSRTRRFSRWESSIPSLVLLPSERRNFADAGQGSLAACGPGLVEGGEGAMSFEAACQNISSNGMKLVGPRGARIGATCIVVLHSRTRCHGVALRGRVARCERRREGLFELGVQLTEKVDVDDFIVRDPFHNRYTFEDTELPELRMRIEGQVAVVSQDRQDAALVRKTLHNPRTAVIAPPSRADLLVHASTLDVAVLAQDSALGTPGDIAVDLYCNGFCGRLVLLVDDTNEEARRLLSKLPFAAVMVRPLDRRVVIGAIAQALRLEDACVSRGASLRQAA